MHLRLSLKLVPLLFAVAITAGAQKDSSAGERRGELEQVLKQRYRLTAIGPGILGLTGGAGSIRKAGGIVELRREGFYGSLERNGAATMSVRGDAVEVTRGQKDFAFPAGEQFYVHSLFVGQDVVSFGLLSTRAIPTPRGTGRLWATIDFFMAAETLASVNANAVMQVTDQWLLPEGQRPAAAAPPAATPAPAPPAPAPRADLKAGMTREEVVAALGPPQREVSYGQRTWLTYPGMVVVLENGKLVAVDRSGQPPAKVVVRSEPDGADVFLSDSFVGSTPATLELPAGTYKVSVRLAGHKDWQREVQVLGGSELTLRARLEK